ncbi:hypothetical protein ACQRIU_003839 [Beauveria bassiana]
MPDSPDTRPDMLLHLSALSHSAASALMTTNLVRLVHLEQDQVAYRAISACGIPPTATKGVSVCRGGDAHTHAHTYRPSDCEHSLQHACAVSSS